MIIRKIEIKDAANLLDMLLTLDNETKNMMYEPSERSNDIDCINKMICQSKNENSLILIADIGSKIVGFLSAEEGKFNRIRHSAYVVVGILESFQGQGIGSKLFEALDEWAEQNKITRLELTVMCNNTAAIHLYQKKGFEIEGTKRKSMIVDGKYVDEYYMAKVR